MWPLTHAKQTTTLERKLDKLLLADDRILAIALERRGSGIYEEARTVQEPKPETA